VAAMQYVAISVSLTRLAIASIASFGFNPRSLMSLQVHGLSDIYWVSGYLT
jgi:hypothetical protein